MDILMRAQAKVVKISGNGPSENTVEVTASEFNEMMVEIIRLRSVLEEIGESEYFSTKHMQKMARDGILPND